MNRRTLLLTTTIGLGTLALAVPAARGASLSNMASQSQGTTAGSGGPVKMLTLQSEWAKHQSQSQAATATPEGIVPPPTPCPQNGLIPWPTVSGIGVVPNCGVPEL